jgi:hypothetical protein
MNELACLVVALLRDPRVRAALREANDGAAKEAAPTLLDLRPGGSIEGLGVTGRAVRDAAKRGELALTRIGRRTFVARDVLIAWLASRRAPVAAPPPKEGADVIEIYEHAIATTRGRRRKSA